MMRSTIWLTVWLSIGRPAAVEVPARTILVKKVVHGPKNIMRTDRFGYPSHDMAGLAGRDALWITVPAPKGRKKLAPIWTPPNKRNGTMRLKDKIAIVVGA